MGVWIEIALSMTEKDRFCVTPCVGVWIEIILPDSPFRPYIVTPCVGVWIEILRCGKRKII